MDIQTYLIFELNGLQYGLEASHVREIFQLPELTPVADAPEDIIGILNLRGNILPVMHLAKRLSQDNPACRLSDRVIVIEYQGLQIGMVVSRVDEVQSLPTSSIESAPDYEFRNHVHTAFAIGVAKIDDDLVMLLNPETLIRQPDNVALMAWEAKLNALDDAIQVPEEEPYPKEQIFEVQPASILTNFFSLYCPRATPEEQHIFQQRAIALRQPLENSDISQLLPFAVVGLGEEYFGIALQSIREFINIRHVRPIPCCPAHIMGNMNLRGEVMTLIDIHTTINLPQSGDRAAKAVIIEVDDIVAGIMVNQVLDVVYLFPSELSSMPTAIPKRCQNFFQASTPYRQKNMSILDLSNLLTQGGLVVDQAA